MDRGKITRAAIGRFARLGSLYDAKNDQFLSINGFNKSLSDDHVYENETNAVNIELIVTDSYEDKLKKLDINAELGLSVLSGLVQLKGSASYLSKEKKSSMSQNMTLAYCVTTKYQEVDGLRSLIDKTSLDSTDATHIVVGIDWGAKCNITCEYRKADEEESSDITGKLQAEVEKFKNILSVKGEAKVDIEDGEKGNQSNFSYRCIADVSDLDRDLPLNFVDALDVARKLPLVVKTTNEGKGVPITYHLLSLDNIRKMCKMELKLQHLGTSIDEDIFKRILQVVEGTTQAKQMLEHLDEKLSSNPDIIATSVISSVKDLSNQLDVDESKFRSTLQKALVDVRSGISPVSALEDIITSVKSGNLSQAALNKKLNHYEKYSKKIKCVNKMREKKYLYVGKNTRIEDILSEFSSSRILVLYMDNEIIQSNSKKWFAQKNAFDRQRRAFENDKDIRFVVVDNEFSKIRDRVVIEVYDDGVLTCEDFVKMEGEDLEKDLIKFDNIKYGPYKPNDRVLVELQCPLYYKQRCSSDKINWLCKFCKKPVEYGLSTKKLYCQCGSSGLDKISFRCSNEKHGMKFVKYDDKKLKDRLDELRLFDEFNIVILGETGVGKSTWINALANYIAHPTLEDAKKAKDIKVMIPSSFSYTTETGESKKISVGKQNDNEVMQSGQSATQGPTTYKFFIGRHQVSLIDTPGIGDVRGLEQDEKNFEQILAHLSYFKEIHAVCILLKPNDSRLTVTFRFCITELLTHLDKSAAKNIVFCFTNSRSTFYRPGDTLDILKKLVEDFSNTDLTVSPQNLFCFDNEAFRFLACLRNGIEFGEGDIATYSSSWDRAVEETNKLFKHIINLQPHSVNDTVSLNNTRRIILELSKPLAETAANIQSNIDAACRKRDELQASKKTAKELKDKLYLDAVDLEAKPLGYPRTVCTDSSCVEYVEISDKRTKTVHSKWCHQHCYLRGVPTESVNNAALQHCRAMNGAPNFMCNNCGHSWNVHMHITYELEKKAVRVIDKNKEKLYNQEENHAKNLQEFLSNLDIMITEWKAEQEQITDISAQFGSYLKKNAIAPFNDEIDAHLDMLIKQEKNKPDYKSDTVENYTKMRAKYNQQKNIITKAMSTKCSDVNYISHPKQIEDLKKKLFSLKHNGKSLKECFDNIHKARSQHLYRSEQFDPILVTGKKQEKGLLAELRSSIGKTARQIRNYINY